MGWKMEIAKMAMYIAFPVTLFHWFNQPENFEDWVIKTRREYYPPENPEERKMWEDFIYNFNKKKDEEALQAMEKAHKKFEEIESANKYI